MKSVTLAAALLSLPVLAGAQAGMPQGQRTSEERDSAPAVSISSGPQNPFSGSVAEGTATDGVLPISF